MRAIHVLRALKDNYIYMIVHADGRCAAVDPGEAGPVIDFLHLTGHKLTHVLCTHHHSDHVAGAAELAGTHGCEVVASRHDRNRIAGCTAGVSESLGLELWGDRVAVLDMPGHTLGQIAYYLEPESALFTGDTLFSAGCGRLFEGTAAQMWASLRKIRSLPADTRLYFGHEYTLRNLDFVLAHRPTPEARAYFEDCERRLARGEATTPSTLAREMAVNPFLSAPSTEAFQDLRTARDHW